MAKKKRHKKPPVPTRPPLLGRARAKLALIPIGTILALVLAAHTYKSAGADDLRTKIYEPLYVDLGSVERSVQSASPEGHPIVTALPHLGATGAIERVPAPFRRRLLRVFEEAPQVYTAVTALNDVVLREMSARLAQLRSEQVDREWHLRTSARLGQLSRSGKGVSGMVSLTFEHAGRSRVVDVRDQRNPVFSSPGGPTFTIRDWIEYPDSLSKIERLWTDHDLLYFDERQDYWYYRLTREDIGRLNSTLAEFLKPTHDVLTENPNFQFVLKERARTLSEIAEVKALLSQRITDPKHLRDLIFW